MYNRLIIRSGLAKHFNLRNQYINQRLIFNQAYDIAKKVMPKISETEGAALNAGTVGFDRELFEGSASINNLVQKYYPKLSEKEQQFMDNEVNELCSKIDDYEIARTRDLPKDVWDYIKEKGFLGMIIPEKYGGKGFSGHGHSQVVQKIASKSGSVSVSVMVPNSLGPGELLMRYGTKEEKDYYLPKLASGEMIPCFGLTGPSSGSDAAAMRDTGIICKENDVLGIKATFKKRYITLAPIAGVVGLAIEIKDPNNLLKGVGSPGISIVLLERGHPGLRIGDRHDPLAAGFMNGTVEGDDVFIPIDKVLGGQERIGFGWNMLMDCLAEGRSISLPALSVAAARGISTTVGSYARIRKQFKVPIAELEGVKEHVAAIASNTMIMVSAQNLVNSMINQHEQPAVISAIMKQQMTNRMRTVVNDAMDIMGGAAICNGPNNFMANVYSNVPIAITVEGANTLTRSLIQFGQGLTRSHPHLLNIIRSIENGNDVEGFQEHVFKMVGHAIKNMGRSTFSLITRTRSHFPDVEKYHENQLEKLTANFALCSDLALSLGGQLKFAEFLSGRFADILSNLYLGYATLWYYKHNKKNVKDLDLIMDYSMRNILCDIQDAFHSIYKNFPLRPIALLMKTFTFPFGNHYDRPDDTLIHNVSELLTTDSKVRELFSQNIYHPVDENNRVNQIMRALPLCIKADKILAKQRKESKYYGKLIPLTGEEKKIVEEAENLREQIIQVDSFERLGHELYKSDDWTQEDRPALDNIYNKQQKRKVANA